MRESRNDKQDEGAHKANQYKYCFPPVSCIFTLHFQGAPAICPLMRSI